MEFEFLVNLIVINSPVNQTQKAIESIEANCTHIDNNVYLMEGDIESLKDDGVDFNVMEEGVVGPLGGLSTKELVKVCVDAFEIDIYTLSYKKPTTRETPKGGGVGES